MYLTQGQENTEHLLAFNVVGKDSTEPSVDLGGSMLDAYEVKFRIKDPDGADVFPGSGSFEDVTSNDGRVGVGRYYAFDEAFDVGWTPSSTAALGRWSIEWRWRIESTDTEQSWTQHFQIEDAAKFSGFGYATYINPARIREEGISATELSDSRLEKLIARSQSYIERTTRNLFRPVYWELNFNGEHHQSIFLGLPIIGIESLFANNNTAGLDRSAYAMAFERIDRNHLFTPNPDKRRNPSIRIRGRGLTLFDSPSRSAYRTKFTRGINNQLVKGVFGFVESDGTVPALIEDAMLRLVFAGSEKLVPGSAGASGTGPIQSETVDRHSISYAVGKTAGAKTKWALAGSKEVEEIMAMYKAPISINAPVPSRVWDEGFEYGS